MRYNVHKIPTLFSQNESKHTQNKSSFPKLHHTFGKSNLWYVSYIVIYIGIYICKHIELIKN